jgi:hypothetical protein
MKISALGETGGTRRPPGSAHALPGRRVAALTLQKSHCD